MQAQRTGDESDTDVDISSLHAINTEDTTDISSLHAQRVGDESDTDVDVSSLMAKSVKDESDLSVDVSSLQAQRTGDESDTDVDVSSLMAKSVADESDLSVDVSSLMAKSVADESDLSVDVSSLQAQRTGDESDTDVDVSSLHAAVASNDVVAISEALNGAASAISSKTISFGRTFASTPKVIGIIKGGSDSPIIACMLSNITTTGATFQFSDDITTDSEYTLEILASI